MSPANQNDIAAASATVPSNVSSIPSSLARAVDQTPPPLGISSRHLDAPADPAPMVAQEVYKNGEIELPASERITVNLEKDKVSSMCSSNTEMKGSIKTTGGYRLDGLLEGDLEAATTVIVSFGARLIGNLKAKRIIVLGTVDGTINCTESLILAKTAVVKGDIHYVRIQNYLGCTIEGRMTPTSR